MRILIVALANSPHACRWLNQFHDEDWDIHLFPSTEHPLRPEWKRLTVHTLFWQRMSYLDASVRQQSLLPVKRGGKRLLALMERWFPGPFSRAAHLAHVIRRVKPDIVHSLEMQHAAYLTWDARQRIKPEAFPPWIYTSWGSDLFYFRQFPEHQQRIRQVLQACDYYMADCRRDVPLAREFGFQGEVLGVFPATGGFDLEWMGQFRDSRPVSARRKILLKGYQQEDWVGRSAMALEAIGRCADCLREYSIHINLASPGIRRQIKDLKASTGLSINIVPYLPYESLLQLKGECRVAIAISLSDGTPLSMIEAMIMGAFPIQSDTVSTAEWITHGANGFLVPPEDPEAIAQAIRRAVRDDPLVDRAAQLNAKVARERLADAVIRPQVLDLYRHVAQRGKQAGSA